MNKSIYGPKEAKDTPGTMENYEVYQAMLLPQHRGLVPPPVEGHHLQMMEAEEQRHDSIARSNKRHYFFHQY